MYRFLQAHSFRRDIGVLRDADVPLAANGYILIGVPAC